MIKRFARKVNMKKMSRWGGDWKFMFYGGKVYDVEVGDRKYSVVDELGKKHTYNSSFEFFLYFHDVEETRDIIIKDLLKDGEC